MEATRQFDLAAHHESAFQALCEVDEILRQSGKPYYLLAGTTLGAVRHGGFIPWDDDIDIGIFLKDKADVARLMQEKLSGAFQYIDCHTDPTYPRLFGKIIDRKTGYGCIDLFPLIKTPDGKLGRRLQWMSGKVIYNLYKAKLSYIHKSEKSGLKRVKRAAVRLIARFFSKDRVLKLADKNERRYERLTNNRYCVVLYGSHSMENETVLTEWLRKPGTVTFNGRDFPTMGDVPAYLTNMYGSDYMTPPRREEQTLRHNESFGGN